MCSGSVVEKSDNVRLSYGSLYSRQPLYSTHIRRIWQEVRKESTFAANSVHSTYNMLKCFYFERKLYKKNMKRRLYNHCRQGFC